MTEEIFRDDAYATSCEATVTHVDERGIQLDRTVFYPAGGGQPGDSGMLRCADGREVAIVDTFKGTDTGDPVHMPAKGAPALAPGLVDTGMQDYLCGQVDAQAYPSVRKLIQAREAGAMQSPRAAAAAIIALSDRLRTDVPSGSFIDIRNLDSGRG